MDVDNNNRFGLVGYRWVTHGFSISSLSLHSSIDIVAVVLLPNATSSEEHCDRYYPKVPPDRDSQAHKADTIHYTKSARNNY